MDAADRVIEVYADTKGYSVCRGPQCRQRLLWAEIVDSGKKMCFADTVQPVAMRTDLTGRVIEAYAFAENHWAGCPDAKLFGHHR